MNNIEISTAHNIVVTYPLATVIHRLLAYLVDGAIVTLYLIVISILAGGYGTLIFLLVFPVITFYHLGFELFNQGQSIGKNLLKLRVVSLNGSSPTTMDFTKRWVFRMIDLTLTLGSLATIMVSSSSKKQRIGDMVAQTVVIRLKAESNVDIETLSQMAYDPESISFHGVTMYSDADMLLLKQILARFNSDPNMENRKMLRTIFERITSDLKVDKASVKPKKFLSTVLREYILLTR